MTGPDNGWQPIETAPKDQTTFLVAAKGSTERWHPYEAAVVVTIEAQKRAFTCARFEDGTFIDEFGYDWQPDGRISDAEDDMSDGVMRLTCWRPLPAPPGDTP